MKKSSSIILRFALIILSIPSSGWTSINNETKNTKAEIRFYPTPIKEANASKNNSLKLFDNYLNNIYQSAGLITSNLDFEVFRKAVVGYFNLKSLDKISTTKEIITIIDFNLSSREKRLWIIDLSEKTLLFNTWVAHGKGSGEDMANLFSNIAHSNQSSLGFYVTGEIYDGKNGRSLRLDGMDDGFNTNARSRAVVVHGAEYVSQAFINQHGRLGRSQGCPALPIELTNAIIDTIRDKTCLFINGPTISYISNYLDQQVAANYVSENETLAKID